MSNLRVHPNAPSYFPNTTQPTTPSHAPPARPDSEFQTIGTLLSSPYDDSDSDSEEVQTPITLPSARLSPIKKGETKYSPPRKSLIQSRINGLGDVAEEQEQQHGVISFPRPTRAGLVTPNRSPYAPPIRTSPSNQSIPQTQLRPISNLQTRPSTPTMPHTLPPPSSPISPYLANPQHQPPLPLPNSPFTNQTQSQSPSQPRISTSSTSDSLRGFDIMREKKALFRGGEEELMSPFSPSSTKRQESGLRHGRGVSGMDFWKRFSVSVRLDQDAKNSGKES
jgi:hypothetical protein